jgi:Domain of unknown function (DUF1707)
MMNVAEQTIEGGPGMTSDHAMRASDQDRERAAEVVRDAYAVGRLDLGEFHDRADRAYSARTWGELRDLTADLPPRPVPDQTDLDAGRPTTVAPPDHAPLRPFAFLWVMAVIWLAIAGAAHAAAPAIPLILLSLFALRAARWTVPREQPPPGPAVLAQHADSADRTARDAFQAGAPCVAADDRSRRQSDD